MQATEAFPTGVIRVIYAPAEAPAQSATTTSRARDLRDPCPVKGQIPDHEAEGRTFTFPITGGRVDSETVAGTIDHSGGIRFSAGDTKVGVEDFVIDTEDGVLTARVSGTETRIPLLDLDLSDASIDRDDGRVVVSDVRATLTGDAAAALNKTFDTKLFSEG